MLRTEFSYMRHNKRTKTKKTTDHDTHDITTHDKTKEKKIQLSKISKKKVTNTIKCLFKILPFISNQESLSQNG